MIPDLLKDLKEAPQQLNRRREDLEKQVRTRVRKARNEGRERWWTLNTRALDRAEKLLKSAPELPVVDKLADAAERAVHHRLDTLTAPSVAGWDEMSAKDAAHAVRGVDDPLALLVLRQREAAGKKRKTVLDAIDARRAREAQAH